MQPTPTWLASQVTGIPADPSTQAHLLIVAGLVINSETREATYQGQTISSLTRKEFALLVALASQPGKVFSKAELAYIVYQKQLPPHSHVIGTHIINLRAKLPRPDLIQAVYGIGYKLLVK